MGLQQNKIANNNSNNSFYSTLHSSQQHCPLVRDVHSSDPSIIIATSCFTVDVIKARTFLDKESKNNSG